jgi:ribosomal protein L37E
MTARYIPPFKSRRRSLASFGLRTIICSACGQIHPLSADEPDPEVCSNCGLPHQGVEDR